MKIKKNAKRIFRLLLCVAMITASLAQFEVSAETDTTSQKSLKTATGESFRELTFSDYGINDGTTAVGQQTWGQASMITNMDGVAFTGGIILQNSVDLPHWNAVRVGFGSGAGQGGIGVFRSGTSIFLYNYANDGAAYLTEVAQGQHGVADLDTTAVTVRFTFKYIEDSTDVAITFSLNGTKYYEGTLAGGQELLGNQVLVWARTAEISVESVETGEAFKELTFFDYRINDGTTAVGQQTSGQASMITNMDGVAFTGGVILQNSVDLPHWNAVRVGFGSGAGQGGIGVFRSGTSIFLYDYANNGATHLTEVAQEQHGVADLDTTAVTIRFTFKYIEDSTDVAITFSLNGTKYYEGTLVGGQELLGNQVLIWARTAEISVESVETEIYKELTFSDYGIADGTTETGQQTSGQASVITNMDGVAFTGDVILQDSNVFWWKAVRVGFGSGTNQGGIGVTRTGERIIIYNYCLAGAPEYLGEVGPAQHGVENLDTTAITVRYTFRYVKDSTDVAITISINGIEYYEGILTDGQNLLSNQILIWAYDAPITVGSVLPKEMARDDEYHDLATGEYLIKYEGVFSVDGQYKQSQARIANTGIYNIAYRARKAIYTQDVIAYRLGQIHVDGSENDVRALVKALKAKNNPQADRYVTKAADFNKSNAVEDDDLNDLREILVGKKTLD